MWLWLAIAVIAAEPDAAPRPTLVVFDFDSAGDGGELGRWVARNIRLKAERENRYTVVDDIDRREVETDTKFVPSFGAKPDVIASFARKSLAADTAVWGKVEQRGDALDITVRAVRCGDETFTMLIDRTFTAANQHLTAEVSKEVLRILADEPEPKVVPDAAAEEAWRTGPNLVTNPGFELGGDHPDGWEPFGVAWQHGCASWAPAPNPDGRGKCIRLDLPRSVAESYGAAYYSDPIDTSQGTLYRFSVRVRSEGPAAKVFVKHYAQFGPAGDEKAPQWREVRRAQLNCHGAGLAWKTFTQDFRPRRSDAYDPKHTRIELYAYGSPGSVCFDDVVLKRLK